MRRALAVVVTAVAFAGVAAQNAAAQVDIDFFCSPEPVSCNGWFRTNVTVTWTVNPTPDQILSGCGTQTITSDSVAAPIWCQARKGTTTGRLESAIQLDKTPPVVTAGALARVPDANGWYRAPVSGRFSGDDRTSGVRICSSTTYTGPDSKGAQVSGRCTDNAGNISAASSVPLRYDATGPVIRRGKPAREPDHGRWYNRPVKWTFKGRDALSGHARCARVIYSGPDGVPARVIGACTDFAGNVSYRSFAMRYDATPPARPKVRTMPQDRRVRLRIRFAPDVHRIAIIRSPGVGGTKDSTLYRGRPRSFTDRHARNGKRYRYTVVARDRAANTSRRTVSAVPNAHLITPADGAVLGSPPLLRWTPVREADYYNVQLRRDGHKVLSRWPRRPRLQLDATWRFGGHVRHLVPGTYRWDVWPGFGPQRDARYGRRIGARTFVIPGAVPAR